MKLTRAIAIGVIAASLGLGAIVNAQSLRNADEPAEFPPVSYKGKQYVDSRGCVYIRAGIDGNVTWVPRVARDRKVICGFKPTVVAGAGTISAAPKLGKGVVQIAPAVPVTQTKPARATSRPAQQVQPQRVQPKARAKAAPAPKPTTKRIVRAPATVVAPARQKTRVPASPPTVIRGAVRATPRAVVVPTPRAVAPARAASTCRNGSVLSQKYGASTKYKVRCGPQAELPYTPGTGRPTANPPVINLRRSGDEQSRLGGSGAQRVLPRHVYEQRQYAVSEGQIPSGYRRAFEDGRLNPRRAEMTLAGVAATDSIWRRGVPRKLLVDRRTGKQIEIVSTKSYRLSYGAVVPQVSTRVSTQGAAYKSQQVTGHPVVSTRATPNEKVIRLSGQNYVHAATYRDAAVAQKAALVMKRRGFQVRIGKYTRQGQVRRMVLVGPFANEAALKDGLNAARQAGFSSATVRR